MKTIKMTKTQKGSPDGCTVNTYEKGKTYTMPDSLANVFLKEKWAVVAKKPAKTETPEGQMNIETPESPKVNK